MFRRDVGVAELVVNVNVFPLRWSRWCFQVLRQLLLLEKSNLLRHAVFSQTEVFCRETFYRLPSLICDANGLNY